MDLTRLAGRGELSTLLGDSMVKTDIYFKTLGFYRAAESEYPNLSPRLNQASTPIPAESTLILIRCKFLPAEYVVLGGKPQAWKPADSLVCGLLMSYRLDAPRAIKPILYEIYTQAGPDTMKYLMPWVPESAPYISSSAVNQPPTALTNAPGPCRHRTKSKHG